MFMKLFVISSLTVACFAEEAVREKRSAGYHDSEDKYGDDGGYGDDGYGSEHGYHREEKHDFDYHKKDQYKSKYAQISSQMWLNFLL